MSIEEELSRGLLSYRPMSVQESFHRCDKKVKILIGGNGSGKTIAGCAEGAWELLHGRRKGQLPSHGWIIRQTFPKNRYTDPIFTRYWHGDEVFGPFVPEQMQKKLSGNPKSVMELTNGSTATMRTWAQGWKSIQGEMPDWIHVDEECDTDFMNELMVRMYRKPHGQIFVTVTDTVAEPWLLDLLEQSSRGSKHVEAFRADTRDNIHLDQEQVAAFSEGMDEVEQSVRLGGGLRLAAGKVYKCWSEGNWRDAGEVPLDGTDYVYIDPGVANPCAVLWVRVMKPELREIRPGVKDWQSDMWLLGEYYKRGESDVSKHVRGILEKSAELRSRPAGYYIDRWSANQRLAAVGSSTKTVLEVWRAAGLLVQPCSTSREMWKYERFRETERWIKLDDASRGNIYAVRPMPNFNRELFKYVVTGLVENATKTNASRRERFRGDNHLIFGMECAAVMRPRYVSDKSAERAVMTQSQVMSRLAWERIGNRPENGRLWTTGELGVLVRRKEGGLYVVR